MNRQLHKDGGRICWGPCDEGIAIHSVWVERDRRCQGIGTTLVRAVQEIETRLVLDPFPTDEGVSQDRLEQFYHRLGFHLDREIGLWVWNKHEV